MRRADFHKPWLLLAAVSTAGLAHPPKGRVAVTFPPHPAHGLTEPETSAVLKANLPKMRTCYMAVLRTAPTRKGDITLKFTIAPTGKVSAASITESGLNDPAAEACLIDAMKHHTFPKPRDGQEVTVAVLYSLTPN